MKDRTSINNVWPTLSQKMFLVENVCLIKFQFKSKLYNLFNVMLYRDAEKISALSGTDEHKGDVTCLMQNTGRHQLLYQPIQYAIYGMSDCILYLPPVQCQQLLDQL